MGVNGAWVGVRAVAAGDVLATLGLTETGEIAFGDRFQSACLRLGDWVIVVLPGHDAFEPAKLAELSRQGETVTCQRSDVVSCSEAGGYRDGARIWSVGYDPEADEEAVSTSGEPPPELAAVSQQLAAELGDDPGMVAMELPTELVFALCGYSPERETPSATTAHVVEPLRQGAAGRKQSETRAAYQRMNMAVRQSLFPMAEALGFEPRLNHPEIRYGWEESGAFAFLRVGPTGTDALRLVWRFQDDEPRVTVRFQRIEPDAGMPYAEGLASLLPRRRTLLERFRPPRRDLEADIAAAIAGGADLLHAVDRYFVSGALDDRLKPPQYGRAGA